MTFLINYADGSFYYNLFYCISLLVGFFVFVKAGLNRNYSIGLLLILVSTVSLFVIIGSRFIAFDMTDWLHLIDYRKLPPSHLKNSLGGILCGWMALYFMKKWLGITQPLSDVYLWAVVVALIFQRFGCLIMGCCFGHPTHLPWGVRYGVHHRVWQHHYGEQLIHWSSDWSLPVHPTPLYFILGYFLLLACLFVLRSRFRSPIHLALVGFCVLFGMRFIIEFFQSPLCNHNLGGFFLGLKGIQWLLLGILLLCLFRLFCWPIEPSRQDEYKVPEKYLLKLLFLLILSATLLFSVQNWLSPIDLLVFAVEFLMASCALCLLFFKKTSSSRRWSVGITFVMAILLMAQTTKNAETVPIKDKPVKLKKLVFGALTGDLKYSYLDCKNYDSNGCSTDCDEFSVGPGFASVGAFYENLLEVRSNRYSGFGLGGHLTSYKVQKNQEPKTGRSDLGLVAYWRWLRPHFGLKTGLHLGSFEAVYGDDVENSFVQPLLQIQAGPTNKIFAEASIGDDLPYGISASVFRVGIGIGLPLFGIENQSMIRLGRTNIGDLGAWYISPEIQYQRLTFQPSIRFGNLRYSIIDGPRQINFGLNFGYSLSN